MNHTEENYGIDINTVISNIKNNNDNDNNNNNNINKTSKKKNIDKNKKNMIQKQYDSLNYSLEMHKVRKNKKADFDIYSSTNFNIEDKDIDKALFIPSWKDLDEDAKIILIENYANLLYNKYGSKLSLDYIIDFINNNKNKIKYDKINKCICDLSGLNSIIENNEIKLSIKKNVTINKNSHINKLRKSLKKKS